MSFAKLTFFSPFRSRTKNRGFTILELLVILSILAITAIFVFIALNPSEFVKRSYDVKRQADLKNLDQAIATALGVDPELTTGDYKTIYTSLPDNASSTCGSWSMPPLPADWRYNCVTNNKLQKVDGSGWLPVNFQSLATGPLLSALPLDPVNTAENGLYYTFNIGGSWKLTTILESDKYGGVSNQDGGIDPDVYEIGSKPFPPSLSRYCPADEWTQRADLGGVARYGAVAFSVNGKGYVGTGKDVNGVNLKDLWEYDPFADTWTQKADLGGMGRYEAAAFSIVNKGYIGTGRGNDDILKDFWEYDPVSNIWTLKTNIGGGERGSIFAFSIGNYGYLGIGYNSSEDWTKDFWQYDPAVDNWTRKANFPGTAGGLAVGFPINNKGYVGTGYDYNKEFWEYDPLTNSWTRKADFGGTARFAAIGFSLDNKGYIGLGSDINAGNPRDFWEYDQPNNSWVKKADFEGDSRSEAVSLVLYDRGYVVTGNFCETIPCIPKKDTWRYCR